MQFADKYKTLNAAQRQAVDTVDGPVMVVAGPGTGKTQILTLRIANILQKTDTPPEAILALTFTEKAAANMRQRLAEVIGSNAYRVRIATFHGFCNGVIQTFPEEFPHIIGSSNISEAEQVGLFEEIIGKLNLKELRPFGDRFTYLRPVMRAISDLKREGVSPEKFKDILKAEVKAMADIPDLNHESGKYKGQIKGKYAKLQDELKRNHELALIYLEYQKALSETATYDYNDMIIEVAQAMERNQTLLRTLQETYLYILVDEHQDTNKAQNRVLELVSDFHENPNLFVVGDEKQAIFRFQGASLENFRYFKKRYPSSELIYLEENYRSNQQILDTADTINSGQKKLKAQRPATGAISVFSFSAPAVEEYFLASHIKQRLASGTKPEEIAVFYRNNADASSIIRIFEKMGIPFAVESDQSVLGDEDIRKFLLVLETLRHFGDPIYLYPILYIDFLDIQSLDAYKLTDSREVRDKNPYDIMRSEKYMLEIGIQEPFKLTALYEKLSRLKTLMKNRGALSAFDEIVTETGFLAYILTKPEAPEKISKLHALFDQIKDMVEKRKDTGLDEFMVFLDTVREHSLSMNTAGLGQVPGRIRLMTVHKAKGLEFDYIYIINTVRGHWDGSRGGGPRLKLPRSVGALLETVEDEFTELEDADERNLFYVALTRARHEIVITYSQTRTDGKIQEPSKFILELREDLVNKPDTAQYETEYTGRKDKIFLTARQDKPSLLTDKAYLNELFRSRSLSPSALNNFLECPRKYFFLNLLQIPEAPNKFSAYGSSVHRALQLYFEKRRQDGEDPGVDFLLTQFNFALRRQPIQQNDYLDIIEKGKITLSGYYGEYVNQWRTNVLTEYKIDGVQLSDDVRLAGRLDKLEILDNAGNVNVVDYKTKQPMSRNAIEGKTASQDSSYFRQMVFYKLLLDRQIDKKFKMQSAEIDFIEPNDSGKFKKEKFIIEPSYVKDLETLILDVADQILKLSFWSATCEISDCKYCHLRMMMATS